MRFLVFLFIVVPTLASALNILPLPQYWLLELNLFFSTYYLAHHIVSLGLLSIFPKSLLARAPRYLRLLLLALIAQYALRLSPFIFQSPPSLASLHLEVDEYRELERLQVLFISLEEASLDNSLKAEILRQDPDIVALGSWNTAASETLNLSAHFPHHAESVLAEGQGSGVAIFSKLEIRSVIRREVGDELPPVLVIELLTAKKAETLSFVLLQGVPPFSQHRYQMNRLIARRLSTPFRASDNKLIIVGALNAPQSSLAYARLRSAARTRDAMAGFGLWRTYDLRAPWLRFTLDHVLYRGRMLPEHFKILDNEGLAHAGILVDFLMAPEDQATTSPSEAN